MLIYDPALDPYHSSIRILAILDKHIEGMDLELVRLLEFYLANPSKTTDIKLPSNFRYIKKIAEQQISPYRNYPHGKTQFERMKPIFTAAIHGLVAAGYLNDDFATKGILLVNFEKIPNDLKLAINSFTSRQETIKKFIIELLPTINFSGPGGLKQRTGLLDYKYDIV